LISKAHISQIRLLHHKKHRDAQGLFIVEGVKSCMEVLHSNLEVAESYLLSRGSERGLEVGDHWINISEKEMSKISCLTSPSEMLCIVKKPKYDLNCLERDKPLLVLDAIRDPGNLGTIIRTADWFGFSEILCSEDCVEFTNPKVIQSSMGSFTRVKVVYADLVSFLETERDRTVYGLFTKGEPIGKQLFKKNDIVILGSESHGISEPLFSFLNNRIEIPVFLHQAGIPESLNAAVAAGIFMYEYRIHSSRCC